MLGMPVPFLKTLMSQGRLGAKLAGGRWLLSVRDLERLRREPPCQPGETGGGLGGNGSNAGRGPVAKASANPEVEDLEELDARVQSLADRIEVELAYLGHRQRNTVWDKLRADNYNPNASVKSALPGGLRRALEDLKRTKQEYTLLRETGRYKRLLRSLPGYDHERVARVVVAQQSERGVASPRVKPLGGIDGYRGGSLSRKGYWGGEEGDPPPRTNEPSEEARLLILRQRALAAARSMRDRGKGKEARDAAETEWARARRESERLEQGSHATREHTREPKPKPTVGNGGSDAPTGTNRASASTQSLCFDAPVTAARRVPQNRSTNRRWAFG